MNPPHGAFVRTAARRRHLDQANLLRSLTLVINGVPGGINLGQGVCDLDSPSPLVQTVFQTTKLDSVLRIVENRDEAVSVVMAN